jgi:hypothetical protein
MATTYWSTPVKWVLSGNYTVPSGLTSITHVETLLDICHPITPNYGPSASPSGTSGGRNADISPRTCTSSNTSNTEATLFGTLTATAVQSGSTPAPLAVTAGQIVQVTVTISFS